MSAPDTNLEFLGEITNIGAGNAATALAGFLQTSLSMAPPTVHELVLDEAVGLLGDGDEENTVALLTVEGELNGLLALFFPDPQPYLASFGVPPEMAPEMVGELGNIVASRFLGAVEAMVGMSGYHHPPAVAKTGRVTSLQTVLAMSAQREPFVILRAQLAGSHGVADIVFAPTAQAVERLKDLAS